MTISRLTSAMLLCASTPLMAAAVLAVTPAPASEPPPCVIDAATGLPMPRVARGACASSIADSTVLVQRSDEGLLIVLPSAVPSLEDAAADGTRSLTVRDADARVIFCPASLLDFATGAPGPACLSAAHPYEPGPGALVGGGTVRAGLSIDAAGSAHCPSAVRVSASVTSPAGVRFALTGSIVTLEVPGHPDTCASAYDRIELSYGGPASAANAPVEPAPTGGSVDRIDRLMQLSDEQWRIVDVLLALTPQDWAALQAAMPRIKGGAIGPVPPGTVAPDGIIDTINTILDRVNALRTNLTSLSGRVPDRPDVRDLVGQIDLSGLHDMLANVGDSLRGFLDIARELRDGFETFDVVAFRARLDTVLTDLETTSGLTQKLFCFDDPDLTIHEINLTPARRLLDRTPAVILYGLSKILDAADSQWDRRLGNLIGAIPPELTSFCTNGARPASAVRLDVESDICSVLRPRLTGTALGGVRAGVSVALIIVRFAKNHTKEEIEAVAGVEVVAGGTGGTNVKNPVHTSLELWSERLDNLKESLKDLMDRRHDCLDADKDIESDLKDCAKDGCSCTVPLSVLLGARVQPSYKYVSDLLGTRINFASDQGLPNVSLARDKFNLAIDSAHEGTAAGYGLLCQAYQALLPSTGIPPPASSTPVPAPRWKRPR
jgi:hypothetical protein